jgi:hypothetical protein
LLRRGLLNEITKAESVARLSHVLLAEKGDAHLIVHYDIISLTISVGKEEKGVAYGLVCPLAQELYGFVVELCGFASLMLLLSWKCGYPRSTARGAVVYVGNSRKSRFHAPSMEIINPIDVGDYLTDGIVENS